MNLDFTPEENAFRDEVRAFIRDNYPAELRKAQDEGRPLTSGAIIPRPLANGSVLIEPAGAVYGKPLEGKNKRCKLTAPSSAAPAVLPGAK